MGTAGYHGRAFERELTERHVRLLCPARRGEPERAGAQVFKPLRQTIESINQTLASQLDPGNATAGEHRPASSCACLPTFSH
ncbi:hypothetical protein GCM10010404_73480 [Nonomuraea africana]|uniref:Transposase DDE domain-containing protein n=1 Tax=Nonomuraea africana TaxID=46171 RepID=A0ABR9K7E1_9ACTN|nr:hypothetical protein [Nonomuraea africana]MBE1557928.1 hypothetical protein [Nonomuraea africana]